MPPTVRAIDLPAVIVHEVSGGKVIAEWQYWGLLEFLVQIGVIGSQGDRARRGLNGPQALVRGDRWH